MTVVPVSAQRLYSEEMFEYILSRFTGSNSLDEISSTPPSRRFIVGTLAPKKEESLESITEDEGRSSIRARMMKISFLVKKQSLEKGLEMNVLVSGFVYYPVRVRIESIESIAPNEDQVDDVEGNQLDQPSGRTRLENRWKRVRFMNKLKIALHSSQKETIVDLDFAEQLASANADKDATPKIDEDIWQANVRVERESFTNLEDMITIHLVNSSIQPKDTPRDQKSIERTLFDCRIKAKIDPQITVEEFRDEYSYEGHDQVYYYDFRTINCQAYWLDASKEEFETRHFGVYKQENILPRQSRENLDFSFKNLMTEQSMNITLERLQDELKSFDNLYRQNLKKDKSDADAKYQNRVQSRQSTWEEREDLLKHYTELIQRIQEGIKEIKDDATIRNSFLKMNETFHRYYSNRGIPEGKWRLFQIAFLLAALNSVTKKKHLNSADILHVNTGGGKSEAYFALVIFALFLERASGKKAGISAIVKFPLRMLSIQQLERISSVIAHAEKVRSENESVFGGAEFSLGYYVGDSEDFPNYYSEVRKKLYTGKVKRLVQSVILPKCPLCGNANSSIVRLEDDEIHRRIIHKCDRESSHIFFIYLSDREIYRWRPSVIVSTVDKWASLASQRRGRSLLGGKGSMCADGHGFIPSGDVCEDSRIEDPFICKNKGLDSLAELGPILSIQDEMHLLSEGFGTISAHFEGLTETLVERSASRQLKHIAMSATLNGAANQISELYRKNSFVIPGHCPEQIGGNTDYFFERKDGPKRIVYGLKPNMRDNHYASLRTLLHFAEFILQKQNELSHDIAGFCRKYAVSNAESAQELIKLFIVPLTYHIKKQDAYDMQRLQKTVVTDELEKRQPTGGKCSGITITGDSSLEELKEAIDSIRSYVQQYDPNTTGNDNFVLEPVYATSVVSHGVDVEELNFMVFQGLPYSTSEYIQALSRVGRKNLGIVFLWFYPNRVRDDSFYRNFVRYHETLDHQVRPIPINRSSRLGMHQTVNSLFCAAIINYLSNKKGKPQIHVEDVKHLSKEDREEIVDFIRECYTRNLSQGALELDPNQEVENRINEIVNSNEKNTKFFPEVLASSGNFFFRNQSGMRGIQKDLALRIDMDDAAIVRTKRGRE